MTRKKIALLSSCLMALVLLSPGCKDIEPMAASEPIQSTFNPEDHDLILRRTTLIVRDVKKSLAFYRDALGMEVIYDNLIRRPHKTEEREEVLRLVFLKSVDEYYGVLGLLEYDYEYAGKKDKPIRKEGFTAGNSVLLFNTQNIEEGFRQITAVEGIEILEEPALREYPSYDGKSKIRVMMSTVYDPDGFLVEYNQLLDPIEIEE